MLKILLGLLLASGSAAMAQNPQQPAGTMIARIQAVDTSHQAAMHIQIRGRLHTGIGVDKPHIGWVRLAGDGGTASGSVFATLSNLPGELTFSSDVPGIIIELVVTSTSGSRIPRLLARGESVRVARDNSGQLSVASFPRDDQK